MGLFSKQNNTISDEKMADLQRRSEKTALSRHSAREIERRMEASEDQRKQAGHS